MPEYLSHYLGAFKPMTLLTLGVVAAVAIIILLRWTGQRYVPPKARLALKGDGSFEYGVTGTGEHQPLLARVAGHSPPSSGQECIAELLPERDGSGETKAIRVCVEGAPVGQIAPDEISVFEAVLKGRPARCDAIVVRGTRSNTLQLKLDLIWPPSLRTS
ncbi:hypothetical protein [Ancylobacter pratisalsi]|uniref:Uncharacterized protein n=1 Tax=Ancylobacter pratisalsi TaxID=1745854 RepID=A0A6P1YSB2_9HYPH|nr:hypothetical protein [Ancylobacter pratisalsi]QIB35671.1 hypothetical protein G3A50_19635 [Ancylobacter pratisalsi]